MDLLFISMVFLRELNRVVGPYKIKLSRLDISLDQQNSVLAMIDSVDLDVRLFWEVWRVGDVCFSVYPYSFRDQQVRVSLER